MHKAIALLLSAALMAGCSSNIIKSGISRLGGPGTTTVTKPPKDAPWVWVTLPSRGTKFKMKELGREGDVTVWAAQDGSQMALRDGIVINTRGFGMDLMSAQAPSLATINRMGSHNRVYFDLDGTDTMRRHDFTCTSEAGSTEGTDFARHVVENCQAEIGTIRNEFWFDRAGQLQLSQQWLSQGVGYAAVDRKQE